MNCINLIGRLVKDPDIVLTLSGKKVAKFTIAVNRNIKINGGQEADYIHIETWQKSADFVENYVRKGYRVAITGRLAIEIVDKEDGNRMYITKVIAEKVESLQSKAETENSSNNYETVVGDSPIGDTEDMFNTPSIDISDDDLPF